MVLEVGPILAVPGPAGEGGGRWQFDTAAGLEEFLNRRIGRNELDVLRVMRAYVQAQREYASRDRDGDDVLEFAQSFAAPRARRTGFFGHRNEWRNQPARPFVAQPRAKATSKKRRGREPQPFHGYFFKILTRQGKHAPGGKYDYIINGNMIGGFALVAWPAEYGDSGVMTFIVNQQGRVYQRDLGENTAKTAGKMKAYDPETGWLRQIEVDKC